MVCEPKASSISGEACLPAEWWASIVEIPCIVQGGGDLATLPQAIATGAEFILLSRAIFGQAEGVAERVAEANRLFDEAVAADAA